MSFHSPILSSMQSSSSFSLIIIWLINTPVPEKSCIEWILGVLLVKHGWKGCMMETCFFFKQCCMLHVNAASKPARTTTAPGGSWLMSYSGLHEEGRLTPRVLYPFSDTLENGSFPHLVFSHWLILWHSIMVCWWWILRTSKAVKIPAEQSW